MFIDCGIVDDSKRALIVVSKSSMTGWAFAVMASVGSMILTIVDSVDMIIASREVEAHQYGGAWWLMPGMAADWFSSWVEILGTEHVELLPSYYFLVKFTCFFAYTTRPLPCFGTNFSPHKLNLTSNTSQQHSPRRE